ncbi:hypothetical protein ACHAO8_004861, partial [Botrytis cinerea]
MTPRSPIPAAVLSSANPKKLQIIPTIPQRVPDIPTPKIAVPNHFAESIGDA